MKLRTTLTLFLALAGGAIAVGAFSPSRAAALDYDCADFATQAEAEEYLLPGDPYRLDGDNDGIACEDLPCPCSSTPGAGNGEEGSNGTGTVEPPKPKPYKVKMRAARRLSKRLVGRIVRRSPRLDRKRFQGCKRRAKRRVDCRLSATGDSGGERTTCRYRVRVTARNRHPVARVVSHDCRATKTARLTYPRAKRAARCKADGIAGKRTQVEVERIDRLDFEGWAFWGQPASASSPAEACSLELTARLVSSGTVAVEADESDCEPA